MLGVDDNGMDIGLGLKGHTVLNAGMSHGTDGQSRQDAVELHFVCSLDIGSWVDGWMLLESLSNIVSGHRPFIDRI